MTSILSRLLTSDKPWYSPYCTAVPRRQQNSSSAGYVPMGQVYPCQSSSGISKTPCVRPEPPPKKRGRNTSLMRATDNPVRFGRVPKREKAKILAAMQKVNASSQEKALGAELEDELKLLATIVRAHEETCDYTKDKVQVLIAKAREHPVYAQCPQQLACPLNSAPHIIDDSGSHYMEDFSERFTPAIQGVVEYAKRIPGFGFLSQDDQLTLLKAGVFEVLLVRLACMFDSRANTLISLNGQVLRRESLHSASNARFLLDSMFDFAERLNTLHLTDNEVGLFSAVVVIAADRPGLRNTDLVLKIQKKLMDILQKSVMANHPENPNIFADLMKKIPDLRTLNTLHSEKLLAYKMEPRNQTAASAASSTSALVGLSPNNSIINPSIYATIPHEIWSQYSLVSSHPQCLSIDEDIRSTSPGQQSHHSGSSGSEWSTTDSKDDLMGSPRSIGSGPCIDDAKSPTRSSSFSSSRSYATEDLWPANLQQSNDFRNLTKSSREGGSEHGSSSGDEGYFVDSPVKGPVYPKLRRVDSPTDSGIESGKEHGPSTTPTISVCSSPRSAVDEKVKDIMEHDHPVKHENIEDMPVLKRALQAPPLVNTNMLMDEAYRHHKKFRAARRDAESPSSPSSISLASTHSTLVRTLEQAPRYLSEQQLKRTDLIHNIIMRTETLPGQQQQQTHQSPHQNHQQIPQHHAQLQNQQEVQSNGTSNLQVALNGSYPYTSVPSSSPVPPNFSAVNNQQQQKNLLVCPSGYYIPHAQAPANYSVAPPPVWQFAGGQSSHTITISANSVTPSPIHIHTQFASTLGGEHSQNHPNCPATTHQASASLSPRMAYNATRSPVGSTLVINGGLSSSPSAPSPSNISSLCQLESRLRSTSPVQPLKPKGESVDSQPLNLSKKIFSPPMLKMET